MAFPAVLGVQARNQGTGAGLSLTPGAVLAGQYDLWVVETAAQAIALNLARGASLVAGSEQNGGTSTRITAFHRVWDGIEGTPNLTDSGDHQHSRGMTIGGIDTAAPVNVLAVGEIASGTAISIDLGAVQTTRDECLIALLLVADLPLASTANSSEFGSWANSNLANVTERAESTTNAGTGGALVMVTGELATAGPIGTFTASSVTTSVKAWAALAIQPPAGAGAVGDGGGGSLSLAQGMRAVPTRQNVTVYSRSMQKINGIFRPTGPTIVRARRAA